MWPPNTNKQKHRFCFAQLRPVIESDTAREMQARGAEKRRQNKALREAMRLSASEFKKIRDEVITEMPSAVDILKVQLALQSCRPQVTDVGCGFSKKGCRLEIKKA